MSVNINLNDVKFQRSKRTGPGHWGSPTISDFIAMIASQKRGSILLTTEACVIEVILET